MTPLRPGSRKSGVYTPAPNRFLTTGDGRRFRVWLEEAPRHMRGRDSIVTFVPMSGTPLQRDVRRQLPAGTQLGELTDGDLERMLGEE